MRTAPISEITEKEWQAQVCKLAYYYGYLAYHTHDSRKSASGFPDLCLVGKRVIFAELKSETGKVSPNQQMWLDALRAAGAEAYLWRPSQLAEVAQILSRKGETT
jgi:hypothetical protein